ncbi:hypothetical protein KDD30_09565 [Photobacterium sp. GJ3]|uniref:hypothetical protein n=1 Tax=Photobacterium sp. GJ3 TaxID=2829502 RepID=UPI001B8AD893|nr:hypothetical protein [Photobacterium sp. GJ3]QUJ66423.1 hypothetical protein KDD30_09565 [Photobacterium sp. GJ3]
MSVGLQGIEHNEKIVFMILLGLSATNAQAEVKAGRSSTESSDGSVVELSFKNCHQKPVKITGLSGEGVLLTIDKEGFSHTLASWQQIEFIVPNEAARKYTFTFSGDASEVKQVRVWRKTYDVEG